MRYVLRSTSGYTAIPRTNMSTEWMILDSLNNYKLVYTTRPRYGDKYGQAKEILDYLNQGGKPPPVPTRDPMHRRTWV